ncbi:MAG: type IV pilus twitching motility protein PilT [Gemmatimonadota bacterium]|nr:type IV pilus twitching motility protein PilT [Gemmatimonadota bacterium]
MPQLDRFLSLLSGKVGHSLVLAADAPALLDEGGTPRALTKPLAGPQLLMLVREIAPADAMQRIEVGHEATFTYRAGDAVGYSAHVAFPSGKFRMKVTAPPPTVAGASPANGEAAKPVSADAPRARSAADDGALEAIENLLRSLIARGASDLHLRVGEPPIIRVDGEMRRDAEAARITNDRLEAMLMAIMLPRDKHRYAETNDADFAFEIPGVARFRCNALRERLGAAAVFRAIPSRIIPADEMGLSPEVQRLCQLTKGLVLVTGATGSGKSTTLSSMIDLVNRTRQDHIVTIEDPIEFVHENKGCIITQRHVGVHTQSFKTALRAALREDPDIVLVGELRDLETMAIAIETAETGHLVFGTMHTTTASGTVGRIIDQFPADQQEQVRVGLSDSLKGVISQVLCKKIGGGRVAAREVLLSIPSLSNLIREGKTFQIPSIMQTSRKIGMVTMNDALMEVVESRLVEPREAYLKATDKTLFANMLKQRGLDTSFSEGADNTPVPHPKMPAAGAGRGAPVGVR